MFGALGAVAALEARRRTGRGQVVDASIFESVLAVTESLVVEWCARGTVRERTGPTLPGIAPSNVYPTSDGQILIAANQDSVFRRLVEVMGMPELAADPRFVDHRARGRNMARDRHHHRGLDGTLHLGRPARQAARGRGARGPGLRAEGHARRPALPARAARSRPCKDERHGELTMQAVVPRLSRDPRRHRAGRAAALGADTDAVLTEPARAARPRSCGRALGAIGQACIGK